MTLEVLGPGEGERGCRSRRRRLAGWGSGRVRRTAHGREGIGGGDLREERAWRLVVVESCLALSLSFLVLLKLVRPDLDRRSRRRPYRPSSSPRPSKVVPQPVPLLVRARMGAYRPRGPAARVSQLQLCQRHRARRVRQPRSRRRRPRTAVQRSLSIPWPCSGALREAHCHVLAA